MRKSLSSSKVVVLFIFIIFSFLIFPKSSEAPDEQKTTEVWKVVDANTECLFDSNRCRSTFGLARFSQASSGVWRNISDNINITYTSNKLINITFDTMECPSCYITIEPGVNASFGYVNLSYLQSQYKTTKSDLVVVDEQIKKEWALNLSLQTSVSNNLKDFNFKVVDYGGFTEEDLQMGNTNFIIKNTNLDFGDLYKNNTVEFDKKNKQFIIKNITGKTSLNLDPIVSAFGLGTADDVYCTAVATCADGALILLIRQTSNNAYAYIEYNFTSTYHPSKINNATMYATGLQYENNFVGYAFLNTNVSLFDLDEESMYSRCGNDFSGAGSINASCTGIGSLTFYPASDVAFAVTNAAQTSALAGRDLILVFYTSTLAQTFDYDYLTEDEHYLYLDYDISPYFTNSSISDTLINQNDVVRLNATIKYPTNDVSVTNASATFLFPNGTSTNISLTRYLQTGNINTSDQSAGDVMGSNYGTSNKQYTTGWETGQDDSYTLTSGWDLLEDVPHGGTQSIHVDGSVTMANYTYNGLVSLTNQSWCNLQAWLVLDPASDNTEFICMDYSTDGGTTWNRDSSQGDDLCLDGGNATEDGASYLNRNINLTNLAGTTNLKWRFRAKMSSSAEDANVDDVNVTCVSKDYNEEIGNSSIFEYNTDTYSYNNFTKLIITINISEYNNSGSVARGNVNPALDISLRDREGTAWEVIGNVSLAAGNVTLTITNTTQLYAWNVSANRDVRVRVVNLDWVDSYQRDTVAYDAFYVNEFYSNITPYWYVDFDNTANAGWYNVTWLFAYANPSLNQTNTSYSSLHFYVQSTGENITIEVNVLGVNISQSSTGGENLTGLNFTSLTSSAQVLNSSAVGSDTTVQTSTVSSLLITNKGGTTGILKIKLNDTLNTGWIVNGSLTANHITDNSINNSDWWVIDDSFENAETKNVWIFSNLSTTAAATKQMGLIVNMSTY